MHWEDVPVVMDDWLEKCAAPATILRPGISAIFTRGDVGYYWHPEAEVLGLYGRGATDQDLALCKAASSRIMGSDSVLQDPLGLDEVSDEGWVKIAYSPTLRRAGELLNFFPGKYPGGIPNKPSPLAATLTGGLAGAGLGYGIGWLGERFLPENWRRKRLRRTLALLGGALGAVPGGIWMASAAQRGRNMLDGSDLAGAPGSKPVDEPIPELEPKPEPPKPLWKQMLETDAYVPLPRHKEYKPLELKRAVDELAEIPLGERYKSAVDRFCKRAYATFASPVKQYPRDPLAVNINKMGQTLWDVGADPRTAATTMGALYAAQQMPDPEGKPGYATAHQTGLLGTMMGAAGGGLQGYAAGWTAAKALSLLTGLPAGPQNMLKRTGAVLGIVNSVVPRLFR